MNELEGAGLICDYIVGSGAEVRNPGREVVKTIPVSTRLCREIYEAVSRYPISIIFCTDGDDYRIGTEEEAEESIIRQIQMFHLNLCRDEIKDTELYQRLRRTTKVLASLEELEKTQIPVYKIFLFSADIEMLDRIRRELEENPEIAVASSFETNLEITDVKAQKGPVLKEYIESLGYSMDEVMVLGDSLNDLSMIEMDFGATVAMENAVPEVRSAAKYITKSNEELGVAYAIRELLRRQGSAG
jgi:hypothetical protein